MCKQNTFINWKVNIMMQGINEKLFYRNIWNFNLLELEFYTLLSLTSMSERATNYIQQKQKILQCEGIKQANKTTYQIFMSSKLVLFLEKHMVMVWGQVKNK